MARNPDFDDALEQLKELHDKKNQDYCGSNNPYTNLERVERIGVEPWRGVVIRMMDKFERLENFCRTGDLANDEEWIDDTFKDLAIYSVLAWLLLEKSNHEALEHSTQRKPSTKVFDKTQEWIELERGKGAGLSNEISMNDLREASEKQQEDEQRRSGAKTESLFTPQVPLNIDDDCLGTPKLKFKNKNVSNN